MTTPMALLSDSPQVVMQKIFPKELLAVTTAYKLHVTEKFTFYHLFPRCESVAKTQLHQSLELSIS